LLGVQVLSSRSDARFILWSHATNGQTVHIVRVPRRGNVRRQRSDARCDEYVCAVLLRARLLAETKRAARRVARVALLANAIVAVVCIELALVFRTLAQRVMILSYPGSTPVS